MKTLDDIKDIIEKVSGDREFKQVEQGKAAPRIVRRSVSLIGKARCLITVKVDPALSSAKRIVVKEIRVKMSVETFHWGGRAYQMDTEKIVLFARMPFIIYDQDIFEPLDQATVGASLQGLEAHYSVKADQILRQGFVKQAVGSLHGLAASFDWKLIAIGAVAGYFAGNSLPFAAFSGIHLLVRSIVGT